MFIRCQSVGMSDESTLDDLPQPEYEGAVSPDELETDGDNPNEMTDEQFGLLCDRMRQNGWLGGPIITDTDGLIADGEHRWRAAQEIGLGEVPVRQYDIADGKRRLWRQELNKIHGEHDAKRDALEYDYLLDAGKSDEVHDLVNAADEDLDELLAKIKMENSRPAAYEYDPEHNVYFEDCVEGMKERLDDNSVDCVITDPPYGISVDVSGMKDMPDVESRSTGRVANDDDLDAALQLFDDALFEVNRALRDGGHLYVFVSWKVAPEFRHVLEASGWEVRNYIVWHKSMQQNSMAFGGTKYAYRHEFVFFCTKDEPRPLDDIMPDVLEYDNAVHSDTGGEQAPHPTQKPIQLVADLVKNSTNEGDTILDPFMGSGTTAVAAIQNDRDYIGFEIDEKNYRDVIERRIGEAKRQTEAGVNQEANADD